MPIPKPNKNETQDNFVARCIDNSTMKKEYPDNEQRLAVCFSSWKDSKQKADWRVMEFTTPISETLSNEQDFMIKGIAINETTTHNNHKFIAEELERAAPTLVNRPLLVDHDNRVESIKGKVVDAFFDKDARNIKFEAKVMDKTIKEMIKDGRIDRVSIGAFAEDIEEEADTGAYIIKGLKIGELSLVAVPADENASFAMAIQNSLKIKSKADTQLNKQVNERRLEMEEQKLKEFEESSKKLSEDNKKLLEELNTLKEEKRQNIISEYKKLCAEKKVKEQEVSKLSEDTLKLLIEQIKSIELPKVEEKVTDKPKSKSVVTEEVAEDVKGYVLEQSQWSIGNAMWKMPNTEKYRRLHSAKSIASFNGS